MELNLRTVLVILGSLIMLGILVDGFRRMRRARQEALTLDVQDNFSFPEEGFSSELPNGGARVIGLRSQNELLQEAHAFRDQLDELSGMTALDEIENKANDDLSNDIQQSLEEDRIYAGEPDFQHESYGHLDMDEQNLEKQVNTKVEVASLNLDQQVPLLMDVEELGEEFPTTAQAPAAQTSIEESINESIELGLEDISGIEASINDISSSEAAVQPVAMEIESTDQTIQHNDNHTRAHDISEAIVETELNHDDGRKEAQDMLAEAAYAPVKKPGKKAEILADRPDPSLVLVTHVIPHDEEGFCGEDILYLVNSCDLRHGEKDIFHRFEDENGEGYIQFSMANSFQPGTFNPETLLHERIHGVSLFLSLPGPDKAMDAFEAMTEMASVIARNLGGDVHDESHSIMALQTIEHNRQQVRDFVRKQKLMGKK